MELFIHSGYRLDLMDGTRVSCIYGSVGWGEGECPVLGATTAPRCLLARNTSALLKTLWITEAHTSTVCTSYSHIS